MVKKLIEHIDTSLQNLSVIESALQIEPDRDHEIAATRTKEWLTLMRSDVSTGVMTDSQIQKCITEIESGNLLRYKCNQEEVVEIEKKFHKTGTNNILSSVLDFCNKLEVYKVLRAIGFAESNSVIVGPNGSGKTTLANCFTSSIHKSTGIVIPAQKLLFIPNVIGIPMPGEIDRIYDSYQSQPRNTKQTYDYRNGKDFPYNMVQAFGDEMQNVILKFYSELYKVKTDVFHAVRDGANPDCETKADIAISIWNSLMDEHQLFLNGMDHFEAKVGDTTYPAYMMSEGERNMLYLIGRVLFAPQDGFIIVDEPELYLHKTIVNKLWDKLENCRPDCRFIYLTHDLDFAVSRNAAKSWIRKFDFPYSWEIEPISGSEIPEDLLMRILGSRKKLLFCEGTKDSFDVRFFEILFSEYTIVPVNSCNDVINYTRAFNRFPGRLVDAYGIIDRDVRPEKQIESFKNDNIYAYDVAEVENLFMVEDFIRAFAAYTHTEDLVNMESLKAIVISRFRPQIEKHALDYVTASINFYYQEQRFHTSRDLSALKTSFDDFNKAIDIDNVYSNRKSYLDSVCDSNDYPMLLKLVNNKGLVCEVGRMLGFVNYTQRALDFLSKTKSIDLLRGQFPTEL